MKWVIGEAVRNLVSGTTHALRYTLLLSIALGTLVLAEISDIDSILTRAAEYRTAGGSVLTVEAPGRIDGATCEAFGRLPGIDAAGALRTERELVSPALPRGPITAYGVTEGLLNVITAHRDAGPGLVFSQDVADSLGRRTGDELATTTGLTRVRGVYSWPQDGRRSGYAYSALIPITAQNMFDQCWIRAWPMPAETATLIRLSVLPSDDKNSKVTVSHLNSRLATDFDGTELFTGRITRHAWLVACVVGLLLGGTSVYTRRLELASARHVGVSRTASHVQALIEAAVWVTSTGVILAGITSVALTFTSNHDNLSLFAAATHIALPGLLTTLLGTQLATTAVREKNLFRYFKTR
ncbi:MAG: hypothetical protein B5766_11190 [Candidatus Lumbricidophila eiseniae]|uniref:MacB-like periplasmic core domain-containing protein n=1 Tax=Candidatus Lumbricidiphila eiseniae TaxID=1969409 RepID=A0A2A6FQ00_9MICO|nr:MAG: hypothetical protein B5766_11190 [Candidatus Lumbricidophila eiseniae]